MQIFTKNISGISVSYASSPGLPHWDQVTPAAYLLGEHVELDPGDSLLWLGCGHAGAAAAVAMRYPLASITLMDRSILAIEAAQETLHLNHCQNVQVLQQASALPEGESVYRCVVIELPKGRKLAQRYLVEALAALVPGGILYLAGDREEGILSTVRDAQTLFGKGAILDYHKGSRIIRWDHLNPLEEKPAWATQPGILPGSWYEFSVETRVGRFELFSLPGVFSYDRLDQGTHMLLENLSTLPGASVLDFGCGYGINGLCAARQGAGQVDYVDVDLLAIASTQRNLERYPHPGARCLALNGINRLPSNSYDLVVTNPPFHAGKGIEYSMTQEFIKDSVRILRPGGRLLLVANTFIPYQHLMSQVYQQVTALQRTSKFCVWLAMI